MVQSPKSLKIIILSSPSSSFLSVVEKYTQRLFWWCFFIQVSVVLSSQVGMLECARKLSSSFNKLFNSLIMHPQHEKTSQILFFCCCFFEKEILKGLELLWMKFFAPVSCMACLLPTKRWEWMNFLKSTIWNLQRWSLWDFKPLPKFETFAIYFLIFYARLILARICCWPFSPDQN